MLSYMTMLESEREKDKFQRIYQPMYHVALQILGDVPGTQDCVHDAFLKIISRMDQIPEAEDNRTRSFVLIVVRNTAINLYRERKRKKQSAIEDEVICHLPQLWVYDRYDLGEQEDLVKVLLDMSPIYRDILTLKYVEEYSNSEIGSLLGITEATVRKRLERARKELAGRWEEGRKVYEPDFIFGKGKYIPKRKQGKMRKGKVVLIAALFLLSVTAVTASRGFVFKSSEKTGLVQEVTWGTPSHEIRLPIGGTVTLAREEKEKILQGWNLEKGDKVHLSFQTESLFYYRHNIRIDQALEMGYVYQGEFYPVNDSCEEQEEKEQLEFSVDMEITEEGDYCFYVKNLCSENIILKNMVFQ